MVDPRYPSPLENPYIEKIVQEWWDELLEEEFDDLDEEFDYDNEDY